MKENILNNSSSTNYRILDSIYDLLLVHQFIKVSDKATIYGELEIEPFAEFSLAFQASYWYLKYMLVKNKKMNLENNEQITLYTEKDLNVIWLSVRNENNTIIECRDGVWFMRLSERDENCKSLLDNYTYSF